MKKITMDYDEYYNELNQKISEGYSVALRDVLEEIKKLEKGFDYYDYFEEPNVIPKSNWGKLILKLNKLIRPDWKLEPEVDD